MLSALLLLMLTTVLAEDQTTVTWEKCKTTNKERILKSLPDTGARHLRLINCNLVEIHPGDLDGLPNLNTINLYGNKMVQVDPIVFKNLTKLTCLFLHFNRFTEIPAFNNILPGLEIVQLNNNQIKKLDNPKALSPLVKLQLFDVSSNEIDYIHEDLFKNSPTLVTIYLMHNKLRYIPEKLFQQKKLIELALQDNLIEYVPENSFLGSNIKTLYLHNNRLTHLENTFTSQFTKGSLKTFNFYKNSWECSCLRQLFQEIKRAGVTRYSSEKYDGTRKVCVIREDKCNRDNFYPGLSD